MADTPETRHTETIKQTIGPRGLPGMTGPAGEKGSPGPAGPEGREGQRGAKGDPGDRGPQGPRGYPGLRGETGEAGPVGAPGPVGPTGPAGERGPIGSTGPVGPVGPKGDKGDRGLTGSIGPQGPVGPRGATGERGPIGPQGERGMTGDKGDQGSGLAIIGQVGTPGQLPSVGKVGDAYIIAGDLWAWAGNEFVNVGPMQGPAGPVGPEGPEGPEGSAGAQGEVGPEGPPGPTGPQGDKGETGPRGVDGPVGPRGDVGPQGAKGDQGIQGLRGDQGIQGLKGDRGPQGVPGEKGDAGAKGDRGDVGPIGPQGPAGADGVTKVEVRRALSSTLGEGRYMGEIAVLVYSGDVETSKSGFLVIWKSVGAFTGWAPVSMYVSDSYFNRSACITALKFIGIPDYSLSGLLWNDSGNIYMYTGNSRWVDSSATIFASPATGVSIERQRYDYDMFSRRKTLRVKGTDTRTNQSGIRDMFSVANNGELTPYEDTTPFIAEGFFYNPLDPTIRVRAVFTRASQSRVVRATPDAVVPASANTWIVAIDVF